MCQTVFNRIEQKYLLKEDTYLLLRRRLKAFMQEDEYGWTTISNIYYDTADSRLIRHSIDHPVYKEKLRLRSYGIPSLETTVFLEIKKKYHRIVNKRRIPLSLGAAYDYLDDGIRPEQDSQILKETDYFLQRYELQPQLYLAYDRLALHAKLDHDFRVTFDRNIRSRRTDLRLEDGDGGVLLLPPDMVLMESKFSGGVPVWFARILGDLGISPASFSKYGNIYKAEQMEAFSMDWRRVAC